MKAKTFIGVLASHDSLEKNQQLAALFNDAVSAGGARLETLKEYRFVFTGGTYDRLFEDGEVENADPQKASTYKLTRETKDFLFDHCGVVRLPSATRGGVTILSTLVTRRLLSLLWPFFTPRTTHLLFPENLALLRLADHCRAKKIMNEGSVTEWLDLEARRDSKLNARTLKDLEFNFPGTLVQARPMPAPGRKGLFILEPKAADGLDFLRARAEGRLSEVLDSAVVALISHDAMKDRMLDFTTDHEQELGRFSQIIATGTTGKRISEVSPQLGGKIYTYHSGPKGGDVEIATQILFGACHVVVFLVDALHPHPHTEDIRVVFGACMIENQVRMLSNEVQARNWMDRVIRGT